MTILDKDSVRVCVPVCLAKNANLTGIAVAQ